MILEHSVYSIAIAIIFGMIYRRITGRESSWIIVLSAYAPDVDIIANAVLKKIGVTVLVYGTPIAKDFHNLSCSCMLWRFHSCFILSAFVLWILLSSPVWALQRMLKAPVFSQGYRIFSFQKSGIGFV